MPQAVTTFFEEGQIFDVTFRFSQGDSISEIADSTGKSRQKVASLLQKAFTHGYVRLPLMAPSHLSDRLHNLYPGVAFSIANGPNFSRLAAVQSLHWVYEACQRTSAMSSGQWLRNQRVNDRRQYVAIGGGTTLRKVAQAIAPALGNLSSPHVADWYHRRLGSICFVNATAGGIPHEPTSESSYVACHFAESCEQPSAVYSLSGNPTKEETDLVRCAVKNTVLVLSGIGEPSNAYCIRAMTDRRIITPKTMKSLVGEYSFHPFANDGRSSLLPQDQGVEIMEDIVNNNPRRGDATLATLLRFDSLIGHPPQNDYWKNLKLTRMVAGLADCNEKNARGKTKALCVLLEHGILTHCCISIELAEGILSMGQHSRSFATYSSENT